MSSASLFAQLISHKITIETASLMKWSMKCITFAYKRTVYQFRS